LSQQLAFLSEDDSPEQRVKNGGMRERDREEDDEEEEGPGMVS
jgi:hypothetical protein